VADRWARGGDDRHRLPGDLDPDANGSEDQSDLMSDSPPDLNLIGRLLWRVLVDIGSLRNDMAAQTAIIRRLAAKMGAT
jgi:hypothetical protein